MRNPAPEIRGVLTSFAFLLFATMVPHLQAEWERDDKSIAWRQGTNVIWRFSFDPSKGKTFFDPLAIGGTTLTNFKPEDHPWHYGLWFSWKYINKANYWEENRQTGKAEGATRWTAPEIRANPDGSAVIKLEVTCVHPSGRVDLTEQRELEISAPDANGGYSIGWRANFTAGKDGAVLERTPMPGEPDGRVNGGYAGLGLRLAGSPLGFSVVSSSGPVDQFASDRARPRASALACNFTDGSRDVGGIAIFSDPVNAGKEAPWYVVNSKEMRFVCAAILAPAIRTLKPAEEMNLRYRIVIRPQAWTTEALKREDDRRP
ncbi:MAG TPA: DUF6807 family protein [Verrucomicrobiae bacterium]|nr:DUF6807 family protein [Verrucomicrobiae bacterium]